LPTSTTFPSSIWTPPFSRANPELFKQPPRPRRGEGEHVDATVPGPSPHREAVGRAAIVAYQGPIGRGPRRMPRSSVDTGVVSRRGSGTGRRSKIRPRAGGRRGTPSDASTRQEASGGAGRGVRGSSTGSAGGIAGFFGVPPNTGGHETQVGRRPTRAAAMADTGMAPCSAIGHGSSSGDGSSVGRIAALYVPGGKASLSFWCFRFFVGRGACPQACLRLFPQGAPLSSGPSAPSRARAGFF